jgi:hypothetical protein
VTNLGSRHQRPNRPPRAPRVRRSDRPKGRGTWDRDLPKLAALVAALGVVWVTIWQLHPELLVTATTTTGGDTGAHFALPAYLRSNLLAHGSLTGWYPGWYDGFPLYTYYFVLPDLIAAITSFILPYGLAFKLATITGSVAMPFCAYGMGRMFRLRPPIPAALAAATLPFLFDTSFTIDGGNLFSTLAGEYAFSLSLALSFLVVGLFARGVRSGKGSILTPVVIAATLASHLVPLILALLGAGLVTLWALLGPRTMLGDETVGSPAGLLGSPHQGRRAVVIWSTRTLALGLGLSAWWLIPFWSGQVLANPMGYVNVTNYVDKLFPASDLWVLALAVAGAVFGLARRSRFTATFATTAVVSALAFVLAPQGSLWNERLLPLWFISLYLLGGWLVGTAVALLAHRRRRLTVERQAVAPGSERVATGRWLPGAVAGPLIVLGLAVAVVVPPLVPGLVPTSALEAIGITPGGNQVSSWAAWNYSGYEGRQAYPEYRGLINKMKSVTKARGCGRAMWEYSPDLDRFGTPMALMLLPYWTDGCVGSQEGLFFESSATVPYHFLIQAEVSSSPSNPQVGLPYSGTDLVSGVSHLRTLGVRYLMLSSLALQSQAAKVPGMIEVASSGPWPKVGSETSGATWKIYLLAGASAIAGLSHLPVVVPGIDATAESWKKANVAWFTDPSRQDVPLAASGPSTWPRGTAATKTSPAVPKAKTSHISIQQDQISFDVDRPGTPVVVKVSWYPRWTVQGAEGPWRISPNLMAVVPTQKHVILTYGPDGVDQFGSTVTVLCTLALLGMGAKDAWRWRRRRLVAVR